MATSLGVSDLDRNDRIVDLPAVWRFPGVFLGVAHPTEQDRPARVFQSDGRPTPIRELPEFVHVHGWHLLL